MIHHIFGFADLHFGAGEEFLFFFFFEDRFHFFGQGVDFRSPLVCQFWGYDPRYDLGALRFAGFDGLLDDLAVWLGGYGARAAEATGAGGAADAVEVNIVGLGGLVVYDCDYGGDVEAAGGEVGGEEVGACGGAEGCEG